MPTIECEVCGGLGRVDAQTTLMPKLQAIGERLRKQDNRCTDKPMFCVQQKKRQTGLEAAYSDRRCWYNQSSGEMIFDDDHEFKEPEGDDAAEWDLGGYVDRWETVMVAFTEEGCNEYLRQNGHNLKQPRIYVESFHRCPEMIAIREWLMALPPPCPSP